MNDVQIFALSCKLIKSEKDKEYIQQVKEKLIKMKTKYENI